VDCEPDGNIVVDVDQFRTSDGGYARLALKSVAGSGDLTSVELRRSPSGVSKCIDSSVVQEKLV
jgi:hypothetical protein